LTERPGWRKSFHALTVAQMLGAANDNLFKYTILLLASPDVDVSLPETWAFDMTHMKADSFVGLVFALPFILFGGLGGSVADRLGKPRIIRTLKGTEILLMGIGTLAFFAGSSTALVLLLFLMGTQSAFFGPCKYGVLPELVPEKEMARANAVIQATTYTAIIVGTWVAGEMLALLGDGFWMVGLGCAAVAGIGWLAANRMQPIPPAAPGRPIVFEPVRTFARDIRDASRDREMLLALLLGGIFLHVAGLLLFAIISYAKAVSGAPDPALAGRLTGLMSVGIVLGSVAAHRASRRGLRPGLVVIGVGGVAVTVGLLFIPVLHWAWPAALLTLSGGFAGLFLVPLRTIIQMRPPPQEKGRFMGTAQVVDFSALMLASIVDHTLVVVVGLDAFERMLTIGVVTAVGGFLVFSRSSLYFQGLRDLLPGGDGGSASGRG